MIYVDKGKEPDFLQSDQVDLAWEKLDGFYQSKSRSQKRYKFPYMSKIDHELKPIMHERFHGKCGYCESKIDNSQDGVIDRYRPHNGVRDEKEYYQDLYWWLAYEWDNLIYSCKECSQYKGNYFPVKQARITSKDAKLEAEERLLYNPCIDKPEDDLFCTSDGHFNSSTERGTQTMELLRLNRATLVERRLVAIKEISKAVHSILDGVANEKQLVSLLKEIYEMYPNVEFLSTKRSALVEELDTYPIVGEQLGLEDYTRTSEKEKEKKRFIEQTEQTRKPSNHSIISSDFFPLEYVYIKNFKGISEMHLDFQRDEVGRKSWMILLGENGVGKSTILQAIALGLNPMFLKDNPHRIPSLIKKRKQTAEIHIKERDSDNIVKTILTRRNQSYSHSGQFDSFLLGYGSLRLSAEDTSESVKRDTHKISYNNLFIPTKPLNDITKWLKSIYKNSPNRFGSVAYSIKQLLPHDFTDNELIINNGEIEFKNSQQNFTELSDGFKSTITLAVDIMMKLAGANADMDKLTGIVLIDELGNQLHPRWQMRIVSQLREVFPQINFIISTHHPLCLRGSVGKEVALLKNIDNEVDVITELPDPSGLRVDQILSSEFFGLNSLIDPDLEAKFNRYYMLLSLKDLTSEQKEELNSLKDDLRDKKQLGSTLREEIMYSVIDRLLAQKVTFSKDRLNRDELKEEAIKRVGKIWKDLNINQND
ncbi:MAG: hypothetical protein ACJA2S_005127 [Cyclobacteriaceae bacterium]|jgi:uncharacterized protein (TIGR02646 family)